jgi:L-seryl-tRNA(Ser) seleniumtransferase
MPDEVLEAMREASRSHVQIRDLLDKANAYIAKITNNEAAAICNSAASGVLLSVAACMCEGDTSKWQKLPDTSGMKNEIAVNYHTPCGFESSITCSGAKIIEYGSKDGITEEHLDAAINDKTAAVFSFHYGALDIERGYIPIEKQTGIAHKRGVPCIIDAAAQIPRKENLWKYTRDMGADIAIFSGGKGLKGPQSSGLIVGKRDTVNFIANNAFPNSGIGRQMKIGKEEIAGLMTAVKIYIEQDEDALIESYEEMVRQVMREFENESAVTVSRSFPSDAGQPFPKAAVKLNDGALKINAGQFAGILRDEGNPGIFVMNTETELLINLQTLVKGDLEIVIDRIKEVINDNKN